MMTTLAMSQNPLKKPWVQHVKHVHSQKAMFEDMFNLQPQVWAKSLMNM